MPRACLAALAGVLLAAPAALAAQPERTTDTVDVRDHGARCDGVSDDTAAINAAFEAVRRRQPAGRIVAARLVFPQGDCLVTAPINATGLTSLAIAVEGDGTVITGRVPGAPVIDALGSRWLIVNGLTIVGDAQAVPSIGLQIGRSDDTARSSADNWRLTDVTITGSFALAALYNLNAETSTFSHLIVANAYHGADCYGVVQDGLNHFHAHSPFVAERQPVDRPESFNENVFISADIRTTGGCTPLWFAETSRHRFIGSYAANTAGHYGAVLFSDSGADANTLLDLDMHFETQSLSDVFLLAGHDRAPVLRGFMYRDQQPFATNSLFKLDAGVGRATLLGTSIWVGGKARMFDNPAAWRVSGSITVFNPATWNLPPAAFAGMLNVNGEVTLSGMR